MKQRLLAPGITSLLESTSCSSSPRSLKLMGLPLASMLAPLPQQGSLRGGTQACDKCWPSSCFYLQLHGICFVVCRCCLTGSCARRQDGTAGAVDTQYPHHLSGLSAHGNASGFATHDLPDWHAHISVAISAPQLTAGSHVSGHRASTSSGAAASGAAASDQLAATT